MEQIGEQVSGEINSVKTELKTPQKYKLIIFDFHGTMTDNQLRLIKSLHLAGHNAFNEPLGKSFYQAALSLPSKISGQGVSAADFIRTTFAGKHSPEKIDTFIKKHTEAMDEVYMPIPGISRTIEVLLKENLDVVVLTNGRNRKIVQDLLRKWGFPSLANNLYSSHITGAKKPNVKAVTYIFQDLRKKGKEYKPEEILIVGDYIDDMEIARRTGTNSVLIVREKGLIKEPKPTYVVSNPQDILRIVHGEVEKDDLDMAKIKSPLWPNESWGNKDVVSNSKRNNSPTIKDTP